MKDEKANAGEGVQQAADVEAASETPLVDEAAGKPKVRAKESVRKDVAKKIVPKDASEGDAERSLLTLNVALDKLYGDYEKVGAVPTREALVTELRGIGWPAANTMAVAIEEMEPDPFLCKKNRKSIIIAVAAVLAIALMAGAAFTLGGSSEPEAEAASSSAKTEQSASEKAEEGIVSVEVACDGWDEKTSTPIVVSVYEGDVTEALLSTDEDAKAPDALDTVEVKAGKALELGKIVDAGTYTLAIVGSPVLEDGTIFDVPEPQVVEFDGKADETVRFTLKKKDAEDVTEADIEAAKAAAAVAGVEAGKINESANKTHDKAEQAQGGTVSKGQTTAGSRPSAGQTVTNKPSGAGSSSGSATQPSKPSDSSSSSSGSSSSSSSGSSSSGSSSQPSQPSQPSKPAHQHSYSASVTTPATCGSAGVRTFTCSCGSSYTESIPATGNHNWMNITEERPVYNTVTVIICDACGAENPGSDHMYQHVVNHEGGSTHNESRQIQVGTTTVITGSACSNCGATK